MKKIIVGILFLFSVLSFGQTYTTKNMLIENNIIKTTVNYVITDSIITMEYIDKSIVNEMKKQNQPTKFELQIQKDGSNYVAYLDNGSVSKLRYLFIIYDNKLTLTLEAKDNFTNKIFKIFYY
jgi:hypothetical protein